MTQRERTRRLTAEERRVLELAMPSARAMAPSFIFGLLSAICAVALLATSALLITRASLTIHILLLGVPIVLVRAFAIFRAVFRYLDRLTAHDAAFRQLGELRVGLLDRLVPLAPAGLARTRRGDLLARLVDDVDELQFLPLRVVQPLWIAVAVALLSVIGVALVSVPAALGLLVCLVAAFLLAAGAQLVLAGRADRAVAPLRAELADRIHDTLTNLEVLRAYDALDAQLDRVRDADDRVRRALVRRSIGEGVAGGAIALFAGVATVIALAVGIDPVVDGAMQAEYLTLIALVPMALFEVFAAVPVAVAAWRRVRVSAGRLAEAAPSRVPDEIPVEGDARRGAGPHAADGAGSRTEGGAGNEVLRDMLHQILEGDPTDARSFDAPDAQPAPIAHDSGLEAVTPSDEVPGGSVPDDGVPGDGVPGDGAPGAAGDRTTDGTGGGDARRASGPIGIELRDFEVRWPGSTEPQLRDLDLSLPAGARLLVTGESGAGKTTLANALVRFLDYRGSYRLVSARGSVEARDLEPSEVRRVVGLIEQRPHMFDQSIRQNLLFAKPDATDDELTAVVERVGLGGWMRARGGLDASVGERGSLVSGGQAQRLALARGLLARFSVLVLDEPTANVDPELADRLVADLVGAVGDGTVVIISHTPIDPALVTHRIRIGA